LHQRITDLESTLIAQLAANESVESADAEELNALPTVISHIVLDNNSNNCINVNLTNQDDNPTVLEKVIEEEEEDTDSNEIELKKMSVLDYEQILNGSLIQFLALSAKIGGDVAEQAEFVKKAFE
jgi:adenylyl cyclase-associated protein